MSFLSSLWNLPQTQRAWNFGKLAGVFGSTQVLVQGLGFVSGILIVRWLSPEQYALYMLALTMGGTMNLLADGGISTGVMAEGGKVWQDSEKLGAVLATGLALRRKFAVFSLLFGVPILVFLLRSHEASWLSIGGILCGISLMFWTSLSGLLLEIIPKLHQKVHLLSCISAIQALGRVVLVIGGVWMMPLAAVALIAGAIPQLWANLQLRRLSVTMADFQSKEDPVVRKKILLVVKRVLPGAIYYSVTGQLTVWLIGFLGNTATIAEVGALGRISQILLLITTLIGTLIVPRFARLPNSRHPLRSWFSLTILGVATMALIIFGFIFIFPDLILSILGSSYQNLSSELLISTATAAVSLLGSVAYSLSLARGWVMKPALSIPLALAPQIILAPFTDFSSAHSVLIYGMACTMVGTIMLISHAIYRLTQVPVKLGGHLEPAS